MRSVREAGCLMQFLAGCGFLIIMGFGCMMVSAFSFRAAMPEAPPPVEIAGDCPRDDVQAFVDGVEPRLDSVFSPLGNALEGERELDVAMQDVDLEALREARDAVAQTEAPTCAKPILEAELELIDDSLEILASFQDCLTESVSDICVPKAMFNASIRLPGHGERLSKAYEALAEEAGIILPEEIEFSEGEGGFKIQMDQGTKGLEIEVP